MERPALLEPKRTRDQLREEAIPATDKRIRFIGGLDAYEALGGDVRRDHLR
ncbi:chromosome partitioning protein, ParB family [Ensifer sp. YR511]|nr:chromosome partitioning protein, ParB family [Ensifer sp. YR511]